MSVTQRRARRAAINQALQMAGQVANARQTANTVVQGMKQLGFGAPGASSLSRKMGPPVPNPPQNHFSGSGTRVNKSRRPTKQERLAYTMVKSPTDLQSVRIGLRDVSTVTNTATNACVAGFSLGINQGGGTLLPLSQFITRLQNYGAMYREFVINSLVVEFVPFQSSTAQGTVALAIDPDPDTGLPAINNFSALMRHKVSCMTDMVEKCTIIYRPSIDGKKDPRYTGTAAGRSDDELNFGCYLISSTNSLSTGTSLGYCTYTVDITFYSPT